MNLPKIASVFALTLMPLASFAAQITGTATYLQRIAMPPDAVFEASLEDVSLMDAPSVTLGKTRIEHPKNPPIRFTIDYDASKIIPNHTYAVRSTIRSKGQLWMTTDTTYPVLTRGSGSQVEMVLRMVDQPVTAAAINTDNAGGRPMRGMYSYMADVGRFKDCRTGKEWPVAQEFDNLSLEQAYSSTPHQPNETMLVTLDGRVKKMRQHEEESSKTRYLQVFRFKSIHPEQNCAGKKVSASAKVSLENTRWTLTHLTGQPVQFKDAQRTPHLTLNAKERTAQAYDGCNQMGGAYTLKGNQLGFKQMFSTMMACVDVPDVAFGQALTQVSSWSIQGTTLSLYDAQKKRLMTFKGSN